MTLLSDSEIARWTSMMPSLVTLDLADKAVVYRQGDAHGHFFWLIKGVIKLSQVTEGGRPITTAILRPGDVFGDTLANSRSEHTATAIGDARLGRIAQMELTTLPSRCAELAADLIARLGTWQRRTERRLVGVLTQTVEARLIETLHELALVFGSRCPHGYALEIRLTQQDMADLVCASRPVVTKAMNDLRDRGLLDYTRELICVDDTALRSLSSPR
jgi:CRP-like cAMP-binding protein